MYCIASAAAICPGHNFPAQYVIHVHSPSWGANNATDMLEKAVKNALAEADKKNLKTLALPSIGSGRLVSLTLSAKSHQFS